MAQRLASPLYQQVPVTTAGARGQVSFAQHGPWPHEAGPPPTLKSQEFKFYIPLSYPLPRLLFCFKSSLFSLSSKVVALVTQNFFNLSPGRILSTCKMAKWSPQNARWYGDV